MQNMKLRGIYVYFEDRKQERDRFLIFTLSLL